MLGDVASLSSSGGFSIRYQSLGESGTVLPGSTRTSRVGLDAISLESDPCPTSVFSIPYPGACVSRWSGSISPNSIGWLGGEDGVFEGEGVGSLGALLIDGRRSVDLGVDKLPPASVDVFGLLILLANDAPPLACEGLEVDFECWVVDEPARLDEGVAALEPAADREGVWVVGWPVLEGDVADLAFEECVGRCMRDERAGGLGIMDDVS